MDEKALASLIEGLDALETELTESLRVTAARLDQCKGARALLEAMKNPEPVEFDGKLGEACRQILRDHSDRSWSPTEVRDQLKVIGYDASKHTNLLASIHMVLKSIVKSGDAKPKEAKNGSGTRYTWIGPPAPTVKPAVRYYGGGNAISALSTLLDTNAVLQALNQADRLKDLMDSASGVRMNQAVEQMTGSAALKRLEEQLTGSQLALEKLGMVPKKK